MESIFEQSTQCKYWLFGPEDLRHHRGNALSGAVVTSGEGKDVITNPALDQALQGQISSKVEKKKVKSSKVKGGEETEWEMQEKVLRHFCRQIQVAMDAHKIKGNDSNTIGRRWWRVAPTAIVYFRRFYVFNSLRVHDPRVMLLACLLVAGKSEESALSMKDLRKIHSKLVDSQVLEAELKLLKALGAQLHVYHPRNILETMLGVIKSKHTPTGGKGVSVDIDFLELDTKIVSAWTSRAQALLDLLYVTQAPLLYKPAALAYGALLLTESEVHQQDSVVSIALTGCFSSDTRQRAQELLTGFAEQVPALESLLADARACVAGQEASDVGAWVKASKRAWPRQGGSGSGAATEEPPRKRVKEERSNG